MIPSEGVDAVMPGSILRIRCMAIRGMLILGVLALASSPLSPEQLNPALLHGYWQAEWITCPKLPGHAPGVCDLRRAFTIAAVPQHFVVHMSADNRYQLFVNGTRVARGPARGDLDHWRFETVDLAPLLHIGSNLLAAEVWNGGDFAPMAQMSFRTGFLLQGDTEAEAEANTGGEWKTRVDSSRTIIAPSEREIGGYYAAGAGERVVASQYPWGWTKPGYDDTGWPPAESLGAAGPRGMQDTHSRWMLVADALPPQEETLQRLDHVVRTRGVQVEAGFPDAPVTVPPNTDASILLDQTFETTAYPELVVSGGRDALVRLTYAEALFAPDGQKGNRNEIAGKEIRGLYDEFVPDGGEHRSFEPLWWRTYRYLQIEVHTASDALTIEELRGHFTAYPFTRTAEFQSDDPELQKIWEVGWRTARLCAHETYMDCPYYEQLQYVGDTRIQALISLYLTGDDRLVKNAIELLGDSQTPEGLTESRYPSALPQYIPPFSLHWIGMMHDLWWYRGESEFLRAWLPNVRSVLSWYQSQLSTTQLLGRLPWWPFVDWASDFRDGVPAQEVDGQSAILSLEYAIALQEAADLESAFGDSDRAAEDRALAGKITSAVEQDCWDAAKGLLADTPLKRSFSQQANILGVLSNAIPAPAQQGVIERVLADRSLTQSTYYFKFYLFRAMKKTGLADRYLAQLAPWREMLKEGLTTFAETPGNPRSDCHAWSAHPDFDLLATVAGIESAAPGFARVRIEPHLGQLQHLSVTLPHPAGPIRVEYQRQGAHWFAEIDLPPGLSGSLTWKGRSVPLHPGEQHLML
jgi:alpha-L-rhamnosidase